MSDKNEPRRVPAKRPGDSSPAGQVQPTGNSMKDRLLAERRAAEAAAGGAKPSPAKASASPARPAPPPMATPRPAAARPAPGAKAATPVRPVAKPSGGARPSRAAAADADDGGGRHHHRREPKVKAKSPVPYIASILVVVAVVVAGYMYVNMSKGDAEAATDGSKVAAQEDANAATDDAATAPDETAPTDEGAAAPADDTAEAPKPEKPADAKPDLSEEDAAALKETKGLPGPKDPDSWNTIAITKNPEQVNDPNGVDLTKVKPYGKPPGLDDAKWTELEADVKAMFDPLSGAKGTRAEARLVEAGINAWPAVTNAMLKLDPKRPDDNRTGKRAEVLLDKIRGGTTGGGFNWRMPATSDGELERKDLYFNLVTIVELHDVWRRHLAAPDRYFREKIAKGTVQEQMMGKAPAAEGEEIDVNAIDMSDLGGG